MPPQFDWDPLKSAANWWKHDITLAKACELWLDSRRIYLPAKADEKEHRYAIVAQIEGKIWACIFTLRAGEVRLISCRRARPKEVSAYQRR